MGYSTLPSSGYIAQFLNHHQYCWRKKILQHLGGPKCWLCPTINIFWGIPSGAVFFSVNSIARYGTVIRHPSSTSQLNYSCDVPMKVATSNIFFRLRFARKKPAKRCMGRDDIFSNLCFSSFFWGCKISSMKCQDLVKEDESLQFFLNNVWYSVSEP